MKSLAKRIRSSAPVRFLLRYKAWLYLLPALQARTKTQTYRFSRAVLQCVLLPPPLCHTSSPAQRKASPSRLLLCLATRPMFSCTTAPTSPPFDVGSDADKEATWRYLKFLTTTENTAYFAAQTGYIPVRKSAQNDPVFAAVLKEKPIKQLCFDCMDRGFQGTRNIGGINALDALGDQLDLIFSGEKDIDTALKDAQANGEKAMAEARNS